MSTTGPYQVRVLSGRKAGATRSIPLGELSVGTTLDDDFFIGCVDLWQSLLSADSSANSRSATASVDVPPDQKMRCVLNHTQAGITLRVESGFAEIAGRRLLPRDSSQVLLNAVVRIGASKLVIESTAPAGEAARPFKPSCQTHAKPLPQNTQWPSWQPSSQWLNNRVAFTGVTALAVAGLSVVVLLNPPSGENPDRVRSETREAVIFSERVVAVVSTAPAFLMTESGQRYEVGALVDDGYKIVGIDGSNIELQRGAERLRMPF